MTLRELESLDMDEILSLYDSVGWTNYTGDTERSRSFYRSLGLTDIRELGCLAFMRV